MKDNDTYFTISKTAVTIGVKSHVLRFWEKKFFIINPKKTSSGRRYYSSKDIKYLFLIKKLLYVDGFTIKGAMNFIDEKYNSKQSISKGNIDDKLSRAIKLIKHGSHLISKNLE